MRKTLYIFGMLALSVWPLAGQTSDNPFELTYRLGATTGTPVAHVTGAGQNPFDLIAPTVDKPKAKAKAAVVAKPRRQPLTDKELGNYNGFLFTAQIIGLLYLTLLITLMRSIFQKSGRAIFSENMLNQFYRERTGGLFTPFLFAYTLFFFNGGLLFFLVLKNFGYHFYYSYWVTLLLCIAAVALAFILKHIAIALIGMIFPVTKEASMYSFTIMVFAITMGLALTPLNLAIAYVPNGAISFIYISFGIIAVIYLLRTFRALSIANKFLFDYKFHFLLYICAIEIAPVMVLIRLVNMVQENI